MRITYEIRVIIQNCITQGLSIRKIAKEVSLPKSTVYYEITKFKKGYLDVEYNAALAQILSDKIRVRLKTEQRRINNNEEVINEVEQLLKKRWSPYHIAIALKKKKLYISHETIYKIIFTYKNISYHKCCNWYKYLSKKNKKWSKRGYITRSKLYVPSIHKLGGNKKSLNNLWLIDTFYIIGGFILIAVENTSKLMLLQLVKDLKAETVTRAMQYLFARVDNVQGIIFDRGKENSMFREIMQMLRSSVYFCDAGSPWQKGLVEQSIGQLRSYLPRKTLYSSLSNKDVYKIQARFNLLYRSSLAGKNARQVYAQIKHLR